MCVQAMCGKSFRAQTWHARVHAHEVASAFVLVALHTLCMPVILALVLWPVLLLATLLVFLSL